MTMRHKLKNILRTFIILLIVVIFTHGQLSRLQPRDTAPSFTLQTLDGRIVYMKRHKNSKNTRPRHPIIFHAFTNRSAFLEALWTNKDSLEGLLRNSPRNTRYVFMSFSDNAETDARDMKQQLYRAIDHYYSRHNQTNPSCNDSKHENATRTANWDEHDQVQKYETHEEESLYTLPELDEYLKNKRHHHRYHRRHDHKTSCDKSLADLWKKRLHFVELPVYEFGNWIPYALNRWKCFGSGCALAQVAIKSKSGDVISVSERLDARYDWLPSPHVLSHAHSNFNIKYYGDACKPWKGDNSTHKRQKSKKRKRYKSYGQVALVDGSGNCSHFTKILHMSRAKLDAVLIFQEAKKPLQQLTCSGKHCFIPLRIAASMIPHRDGIAIRDRLSAGEKLHASFQFTPQENYFLAIDGQGKLAEVGLFLYPSMMFMGYEAKWFNYKTDLIHNLTGSAKIIHVFNHTLMQGHKGAVTTIKLPPLKELQLYRNVELDMSLHCGGSSDYDCPHWDHVVQLTVCCDKKSPLCEEELGRWITPFRRGIGRWLTRVTPLLPLFTSQRCTLTMRHPFWERAWRPSLNIRLSDHIHYSRHHYSGHNEDEFIIPYKITKLFDGGKFDKKYNKRYKPKTFQVSTETERVKLVATITGHGSDNHGCAEFCVTSHHFMVNGKSNVRVFKNAATAMGCANRVEDGVEPNEHGTWLYGRDGWCCGQDIVPWVVDITNQVKFNGKINTIKYFGWFNGTDPNPQRNPGNILMNSYLVFYKSSDNFKL